MLSLISSIIDRLFVVIGALLFSQIPNFFVHYTQRLGGHVSELQLQIDKMQQTALKSGKTLPEFIHKFQAYPDKDISLQGDIMKDMMARYMDLSTAYSSMLEASLLTKPVVFIKHLQLSIAQMTFKDFSWGFSITLEGAVYAFIGMFFGYLIFSILRYFTNRSIGVLTKNY